MGKRWGGTRPVDKAHNGESNAQISDRIDSMSSEWRGSKVVQLDKVFSHEVASASTQQAIKQAIDERGGFGRWGVIKPTETIEEVDLSSLYPTQDMILSSNLKSIVASMKNEGMKEMPTAVNLDGKIYVMDGHHRVAAALLMKQNRIRLRIL